MIANIINFGILIVKYMLIGGKFYFAPSKKTFGIQVAKEAFGPVVASKDSLYLIPRDQQTSFAMAVANPIGHFATEASANSLRKSENEFKTELETLPSVVSDSEWPLENKSGIVFVVPKNRCLTYKYSALSGITLNTVDYVIFVGPKRLFFPKGTKQYLNDNGWNAVNNTQPGDANS